MPFIRRRKSSQRLRGEQHHPSGKVAKALFVIGRSAEVFKDNCGLKIPKRALVRHY